ncbi:MAG: 3-phosphoshikimate 1-carboxyvinyltransferase [Candidatus Omnitrophota bacterium]
MRGIISLPGDKSISHRAIILSALSAGKTIIRNIALSGDILATVSAFRKLGIKIRLDQASCRAQVSGKGLFGLKRPPAPIYIAESGTTFRLLLGLLAGQDFKAELRAGKALARRPMLRVIKPLRSMGARISGGSPPITIQGSRLTGITYKLPVASAQVKGALLLAGLFAAGLTRLSEPIKTRDHTERMLGLFKAGIKIKGNTIILAGGKELASPGSLYIPADISSAAFFMVAASILPQSKILIRNVGLNPGRSGVISALKKMGGAIKISRPKLHYRGNEPMGDIQVSSSALRGIRIGKRRIPALIDELPILMVAACFAKGVSVFENAGELRVKETDRIRSMVTNLKKLGADIKVACSGGREDIIIKGGKALRGAQVRSFGDHRTAMSMVIAGLAAQGRTRVDDLSCINKSFPNFLKVLNSMK